MNFTGAVAGVSKRVVLLALGLCAGAAGVHAQQNSYGSGDQAQQDGYGSGARTDAAPGDPDYSGSQSRPITEVDAPGNQLRRNVRGEEDPFAPLGVRAGSFIFYPSVEAVGGYSSNANQSATDSQSSKFVSLAPAMGIRSDWSRHSLNVDLRGSYTVYTDLSEDAEQDFQGNAQLDFDVTRRTRFGLSGGYQITDDEDYTDETYSAGATLSHTFNRLTASLRGETEIKDYSDRRGSTGSIAQDTAADYQERRLGLRLSYEFTDRLNLFADGSVNEREFDQARDLNGTLRGSNGYEAKVGVEFSPTGKLSGDIAVGYLEQYPDEPSFNDISAFVFDANLIWRPTGLTTVSLSASTEPGETTLPGSPGYIDRKAGVEVRHAIRRNILLHAGASYEITEFEEIDIDEETTEITGGIEYLLNRNWALTADVAQLWYESSLANSDYEETRVTAGVRWQQ